MEWESHVGEADLVESFFLDGRFCIACEYAVYQAIGGALGSVAAASLTYPLTLAMTHRAAGASRELLRRSGLALMVFSVLVSSGIYWLLFEWFGRTSGYWSASVVAGLASVLLTSPLWVLLTNVQVYGHAVWRTCSDVYDKGGVAAFYKGLPINVALVAFPSLQSNLYRLIRAPATRLLGGA